MRGKPALRLLRRIEIECAAKVALARDVTGSARRRRTSSTSPPRARRACSCRGLYEGPFHSTPPSMPGHARVGVVVIGMSAFSRVVTASRTRLVGVAIERAQQAVLAGGRHQPARGAVGRRVEERHRVGDIPIVRVVRHELPVPPPLPGAHVEHDDRVRVEVVAGPQVRRQIGRRVGDGTCRSPFSTSSANAVHTAPPPIGISFGFFHVSNPGSPGFGTVLNRHTGAPSDRRNAPTQPCTLCSLPAGPISTRSSKMSGAMVNVSPSAGFATCRPTTASGLGVQRKQVAVRRRRGRPGRP